MKKKLIKIGIDGRLLSQDISGINRYILEMIKILTEYPCEIYIFSSKKIKNKILNKQKNIFIKNSNLNSRISRMIWAQTLLPFWANKEKLDVFWGPNHRIPFLLSRKIKSIATIHDLVWKKVGHTMRPFHYLIELLLMPFAIKKADLIITDSKSTSKDICEYFPISEQKVKVIYPGCTEFSNNEKIKKNILNSCKKKYILFVGTNEPRKNLNSLIKAFHLALNQIDKEINLFIIGGKGWGNLNLKGLISEKNLEKRIRIFGYVNDTELSYFYKNAEFLILPSLYEGFGFPIIEALSYGLQVVTSDISSMPELIDDSGILINPYDENSIKEAIIKASLSKNNKELIISRKQKAKSFSWKNSVKLFWNYLIEITEN